MANYAVVVTRQSSSAPWGGYAGEITSIHIGDGVTSIGAYAFYRSALPSVSIPYGVVSIGEGAFSFGIMGEVFIPASVTSIGEGAFAGCFPLRNVVVADGSSLASVGDKALDLDNGTSVRSLNVRVWSSSDMVYGLFNTISVSGTYDNVSPFTEDPTGTVTHTTISRGASAVAHTDPDTGLPLSDNGVEVLGVSWSYDAGTRTLMFSGSGTIAHTLGSTDTMSTWDHIRPFVKHIVLVGGDLEIGNRAFRNCYPLVSIDIPYGVTSIGSAAISNTYVLGSLVIPASVTYMAPNALESNRALASLTILVPRLGDFQAGTLILGGANLSVVSVYDDGSGSTPTRIDMSDAFVPTSWNPDVVVYFNEHVGGPVYATQSPLGVVTLSGFPEKGAVKVSNTLDDNGYFKTVLDGGGAVRRLGPRRQGRVCLPARTQLRRVLRRRRVDRQRRDRAVRRRQRGGQCHTRGRGRRCDLRVLRQPRVRRMEGQDRRRGRPGRRGGRGVHVPERDEQRPHDIGGDDAPGVLRDGVCGLELDDNPGRLRGRLERRYRLVRVLREPRLRDIRRGRGRGASVPSATAAGKYAFSGVASNHVISVKSAPSASSPGGAGSGSDGSDDAAGGSRDASGGDDDGVSVAVILAVVVIAIAAGSAVLWLVLGRR
jgi:hypothetical protein